MAVLKKIKTPDGTVYDVQDTTYSAATTSAAGLMSAADKTKLNGIATGATANAGTITGIKMNGASKGTSGVVDLGTVITSHQDISGKVSGPSSSTNAHVAVFDGTTGKAIKDSGYTIAKSVPSDAKFTDTTYSAATTSAAGLMSADDKTKLNGIAAGATANVGTITGIKMNGASKGTSGVVDLGTVITAHQDISGKLNSSLKGAANGLAELDANGKVPSSQLPSFVDDVLEYTSSSSFPTTGETGKIYVAADTNKTYRWSGTAYVEISASLALGETSSTAYRGDRGKTAYDHASAKGSAFSSGLYKITTNAQGHVTAATAVAKSDITGLGIPGQDTTYSAATTSAAGLMSADDKTKLNGIAAGAQVNPGNATTSAAGLMSADDKTKLNGIAAGATANVGTITGIKMNGSSKGTSGVVDLGTVITAHQDISGKVSGPSSSTDAHVAVFDGTTGKAIKDSGYTIAKSVPSDAKFTDTTYSSKTAASGGTDVSLVTTGEKYTWNNKASTAAATTSAAGLMSADDKTKLNGIATGATANVGTITGITMNGASKGTSGVVDLGTVITSHQDISGKVSGPASATSGRVAVFDGTTGKVIKDSGYTIAKSVPSDAKFTDTTYSAATTSAAGLMSATDKTNLDKLQPKSLGSIASGTALATAVRNEVNALSVGDLRPVTMTITTAFSAFEWTGSWAGFIQRQNSGNNYGIADFTALADGAGKIHIRFYVTPNDYYSVVPASKADLNNYVLTSNVYHSLDTTDTSKVLGADQGKVLNDKFADYFKKGGDSAPSDMNNTSLIGTYFAQASSCSNLPTSSSGEYYYIICFGKYQIAAKYSSSGITAVYTRGYTNSQWYPWKSTNYSGGWLATGTNLDNVLMPGTYAINGNNTYTNLPSGVSNGVLEVFGPHTSDNKWIMQRLTTGTAETYIRWRTASSGASFSSTWYKIAKDSDLQNIKSDIAYVEDGATAVHNIYNGQYITRNNKLYRAKQNITAGTTINLDTQFIQVGEGIANVLNNPLTLGSISTLASLETTLLNTLATTVANGAHAVTFSASSAFGLFDRTGTWVGTVQRVGNDEMAVATFRHVEANSDRYNREVVGYLGTSTRTWYRTAIMESPASISANSSASYSIGVQRQFILCCVGYASYVGIGRTVSDGSFNLFHIKADSGIAIDTSTKGTLKVTNNTAGGLTARIIYL